MNKGVTPKPTDKVIVESPAAPVLRTFKQQMFGPWTMNDPKVQRTVVRTNASSGTLQKRFLATYPPSPTISERRTTITGGYEFSFNVVSSHSVAGYNIYTSTVNNPAVARLLQFQAQPSIVDSGQTIKIQDITAANPFYWISSVNGAGQESARIPAGGAAPPANVTKPLPPGGGSGLGSGGGRGKGGGVGWRLQ